MATPNTLYHYCSTQTFLNIVSNKSIWLSSLNLSNDTMEGLWAVDRLCDACIIEGLDEAWLGEVREYATDLIRMWGGLGLCLSEKPDMLSQWRGYADDGHGICIGFNTKTLIDTVHTPNHWPTLLPIEYDEDKQVERLRPIASDVVSAAKDGAMLSPDGTALTPTTPEEKARRLKTRASLNARMMGLAFHMYGMKNSAFSEEFEWRLFAPFVQKAMATNPVTYGFIAQRDRIKPYRKFDLDVGSTIFDKIYIGPRNITPAHVIEEVVISNMQVKVPVLPSKATYR